MNQTSGSTNEENEPRPPPYNSQYYGHNSYLGMTYQVGNGNIAVISPPGTYTVHPEECEGDQQFGPAPPSYTSESELENNVFSNSAIRKGFVRKVYLTLMIQLLFTVGIICAFLYWDTLRRWVYRTSWFFYTMMSVVLVLAVAMSCCGNIRRQVPLNFIALGLFTLAESLMLGSVTAYFNTEVVLWAVGATAFVSFSVSLFTMQSKWDFTLAAGFLWALTWSLISFALLCAIIRSQYLYIFFAFLGTVLFSLYLLFDTQRILGGKYEISPEEYVFATLNLYLDIVTLFLFLLQFCRS